MTGINPRLLRAFDESEDSSEETSISKDLIGQFVGPKASIGYQKVSLAEITLPEQQPRRFFDAESIDALARSISTHGVLQPITLNRREGQLVLVAGERRYRAAQKANLEQIPARIFEGLDDHKIAILAALENLQREDLNPIDEADALLKLIADRLDKSASELEGHLGKLRRFAAKRGKESKESAQAVDAEAVTESEQATASKTVDKSGETDEATADKSEQDEAEKAMLEDIRKLEQLFGEVTSMTWESFIVNRLPVLNLPADLLDAVRQGELAYTKANELKTVKDDQARRHLLEEVKKEDLSREELRQRIKEAKAPEESVTPGPQQRLRKLVSRKEWKTLDGEKQEKAMRLLRDLEALLDRD